MACWEHKQRQDRDRQQRQSPVHGQHDGQGRDDLDHIGDNVNRRVVDGILRPHDIVVEARHKLARTRLGEKTQGHDLHVMV